MNTKLGPTRQESSILAVSCAGATASSSTARAHHLTQQVCPFETCAGDSSNSPVPLTTVVHDSLEEEESSQSFSESLKCRIRKNSDQKHQGFNSEFSDSLEDSGEDTDDTTIDSDTGSFCSVDSHLTPRSLESEVSQQDTEYFSESTLYNSALSLHSPASPSHSSFLSLASNDTTDCFSFELEKHRNSLTHQENFSDFKQEAIDASLDYTSCPDLSSTGYYPDRYFSSFKLDKLNTSASESHSYIRNKTDIQYSSSSSSSSSSSRRKTLSNSSMSTVEDNVSPKMGEEFETKKKKGLMSSFRKNRKTSRKLRQQKKAAADGDTTSTGTGVTSDGEQELLVDSEPSAPNSPAPVKNTIGNPPMEDADEKSEETILDARQATHERLNGTAVTKSSSQPNSKETSPAMAKSNKIAESSKKSDEKEERKTKKFGGSLFRKKKAEQVSSPPPVSDINADASDSSEFREDGKGYEVEGDTETPTTDDVEAVPTAESPTPGETKPSEHKSSAFRSYISSVQFVKNWSVSAETPKAQQALEANARSGNTKVAVEGERAAVNGTDASPEGTATTTIETKKVTTSSINGKPATTEAGSSSDKREHLYKILVIGELGTGKTSIIKRYVHQFFSQHYRATIGVDFALKVLNWDNNTVIRLQLWDIAGQERFGNMTRVYYKEAVGAFVVFDVTRAQTFDAVTKWKTDLDTKVTLADGSPIPTVLLANKCDQPKEGVVNNPARMDDYCRERGFSGWFETSAKENINIDDAARFLVNKILSNEKQGMMMTESLDTDKFSVDGKANPVDKTGCRC